MSNAENEDILEDVFVESEMEIPDLEASDFEIRPDIPRMLSFTSSPFADVFSRIRCGHNHPENVLTPGSGFDRMEKSVLLAWQISRKDRESPT